MLTQTIERTTLSNLIHNEDYCRKVIPFIKPIYFANRDERIVFEEIEKFLEKYNALPTKETLTIGVDSRKDLTDDEIIELEDAVDDLTTKKDRGAPSITLADGGRAAFKDGPLKRGIKAITGTDTYKPLENKGFNAAVLLNQGFDEIYSLLSGSSPGLAEGGRIGYKD